MVGIKDFKNLDLQMDAILVGAAVTGFYLWYRSYDYKQRVIMPNPISLPVCFLISQHEQFFNKKYSITAVRNAFRTILSRADSVFNTCACFAFI